MQQTVESINKFVKIQDILKGESGENLSLMAKVLCKPRFDFPRFENPHFITGRCEMGKSRSARIRLYSKFQKYFHDWPAPEHRSIMNTLLRFGIVVDFPILQRPVAK